MKTLIAALILSLPGLALAGGSKHHIPPPVRPGGGSQAVSGAAAGSASKSNADSSAQSTAAATASPTLNASQNASSTSTSGDSSAQANGTQAVSYTIERSAPSLGQGSIMLSGCGAGGNAGGSNTHGAAILGIAWTPDECKRLLLAEHYLAIGMPEAACDVLNSTATAGKVFGPGGKPSCAPKSPPVVAAPSPAPAPTVTREQQRQAIQELAKKTGK